MYFVKHAEPKALPLVQVGTFAAAVKWCLKAQKTGLLPHTSYEIHGQDSKRDPVELVATFEIEDELVGAGLL